MAYVARRLFLLARLACLLVVASLAFRPFGAGAHAPLARADPAPGATLSQSPAQLFLSFAEPIDPERSRVRLLHSDGREVTGLTKLGGQPGPSDMIVRLPESLAPDVYTVSWFTVSSVDGHTRQGSYAFTVLEPGGGRPAAVMRLPAVAGPRALPAWTVMSARLAALVGAVLLTGTAAFAVLTGPVTGTGRVAWPWPLRRQLALAAGGATALLVLGTAVQLAAITVPLGGREAVPDLAGSRVGRWLLIRVMAGVVAGWLLCGTNRGHAGRRAAAGALPAAIVVILTFSLTSHAAAGRGAVWATLSDLVHLLAASVWLGTLAHVAIALYAERRAFSPVAPAAVQLLRRFSTVAAISVALLLATGTVNALAQVPSAAALVSTGYGRTLLGKLSAAVVLPAIAATNAFYFRPRVVARSAPVALLRGFRRAVLLEAVAGLTVLALTAALVERTPARSELAEARLVAEAAGQTNPVNLFSGQGALGGGPLTLTLIPGRLGVNYVAIEVDIRLGLDEVLLTALGPDGATARSVLRRSAHGDAADERAGAEGALTGSIDIKGAPGQWTAVVSAPRLRESVSFVMALERDGTAAPGGAWGSPAPQVAGAGWGLLACGTVLVLLVLVRRAAGVRLPPRFTGGVAGAAAVTAAVCAIALLPAAGAVTGGTAPPSGAQVAQTPTGAPRAAATAAAWGRTTRVRPVRSGGYTRWKVPTAASGLMIPTVDADGRVWVGEMSTGKLAVLDPDTDTYTELDFPGTGLAGTMGAGVDAAGRVWVAQSARDALGRFDPADGTYREFAAPTAGAAPSGIALDDRGRVWFTELGAGKIGVYDPAADRFTEYPISAPRFVPYWLAVAPDGRVWFTSLTSAAVGVIEPASGRLEVLDVPSGGGTTGIAVAPDGGVWVSSLSGKLVRLDPGRGTATTVSLPRGLAYGIAVAPNGVVWVGTTEDAVFAFDPQSQTLREVRTGAGAWWVTAGRDGSVWVAEGAVEGNALGRIGP
jgi:copper transport protein